MDYQEEFYFSDRHSLELILQTLAQIPEQEGEYAGLCDAVTLIGSVADPITMVVFVDEKGLHWFSLDTLNEALYYHKPAEMEKLIAYLLRDFCIVMTPVNSPFAVSFKAIQRKEKIRSFLK